jgi:hypothetical protein
MGNESGPQMLSHLRACRHTESAVIDMSDSTCAADGCDRDAKTCGLCYMHYQRLRKHGTTVRRPNAPLPPGVTRPCAVEGCDRNGTKRGWCEKHYTRWRKYGIDPGSPRQTTPMSERFWAKVQRTDDCWLWTGGTTGLGYGSIWDYDERRLVMAHRVSYEMHVGPIPAGLHLDHLCRNPRCVRPEHLEPVTIRENIRRSPLAQENKTHCPAGHEYTPENTYRAPGSPNCRHCRACSRERYGKAGA